MRTDILERKEEILEWIESNQSKSYMSKELRCKPETLNSYLDRMGIDYSGNQGGKGIKSDKKRVPALEYAKTHGCRSYVLKKKLIEEGTPENLAEYKASELLTPDKLEKINIAVENSEGRRLGVTFFFDKKEELELLGKYFHYNPHVAQVKDAKLLILLLKMMEEL